MASDDEKIDAICDQFESALRAGDQPVVADFVQAAPLQLRRQLERELKLLERELAGLDTKETQSQIASTQSTVQDNNATEHPPLRCPKCSLKTLHVAIGGDSLRCESATCFTEYELLPKGEPRLGRISHFEIIGLIGQGGFGRVWLARNELDGSYAALKIPRRGTNSELTSLFIRETRYAYAALKDARTRGRIPQLIASGKDGDIHYLAFEFLPGVALSSELNRKKILTARRASEIAREVAETLQVAHDNGLVHRDVKPGNIILSNDSTYLCDFGIAKVVAGTMRDVGQEDNSFCGTLAYASPEHAIPSTIDARSDIFSLGIVLFEMLSGSSPFPGATPDDAFKSILDDSVVAPELPAICPGVSPELGSICSKCLAKMPENRYQSAGELAIALKDYLARSADRTAQRRAVASNVESVSESNGGKVSSSRRRRVVVTTAIVAVAVIMWYAASLVQWTFDSPGPGSTSVSDSTLDWLRRNQADLVLSDAPLEINGEFNESIFAWEKPIERFDSAKVAAIRFPYSDVPNSVTANNMQSLKEFPNLQALLLRSQNEISPMSAENIGTLKNLEFLTIKSPPLSSDTLKRLGTLPNLAELVFESDVEFGDGEFLDGMPNLMCLHSHRSRISRGAITNLAKHPKLKDLRLLACPLDEPRAFEELLLSNSLSKVHINAQGFSVERVKQWADKHPKQLTELGFSGPEPLDLSQLFQALMSSPRDLQVRLTLAFEPAPEITDKERSELERIGIKIYPSAE